jgi:hypothetical protein
MQGAMIAGAVYFLALFALGFILGTLRVLFVAPHFGDLAATFAEVPVMLTAGFYCCRWAVRRWHVSRTVAMRWAMVLCFLTLLILFETLLGLTVFGRTLDEQWTALATPAGMLGLCAQLIAALFPTIVGDGEQS